MFQVHAGRRPVARLARPLTCLAVILAACSASACSTGTIPAASSAKSPGVSVQSSRQAQPDAGVHSSPGAVVADWVHQVASGNLIASCRDEMDPAQLAGRLGALCTSSLGRKAFTAYHGNFLIDGIRPGTPVTVTAAHITGSKATVSGSDVRVGVAGASLQSLMTAHSRGIKPGQLAIVFEVSRIDGAWYSTGMNITVG